MGLNFKITSGDFVVTLPWPLPTSSSLRPDPTPQRGEGVCPFNCQVPHLLGVSAQTLIHLPQPPIPTLMNCRVNTQNRLDPVISDVGSALVAALKPQGSATFRLSLS